MLVYLMSVFVCVLQKERHSKMPWECIGIQSQECGCCRSCTWSSKQSQKKLVSTSIMEPGTGSRSPIWMALPTLTLQYQVRNEKSSRQELQRPDTPEGQRWSMDPVCPGLRTGLHLIPNSVWKFPSLCQARKNTVSLLSQRMNIMTFS